MAQVIVSVAASAGDAHEFHNGTVFNSTYSYTYVGDGYHTGLYFVIPSIASGDTIDGAIVTVSNVHSTNKNMNSTVYANDVDNAVNFATNADVATRVNSAVTTANVVWTATFSQNANPVFNSPEIKTVVQEVIDRAGWAAGNGLVILLAKINTNKAQLGTYDRGTSSQAKITIDYTAGATTTNLCGFEAGDTSEAQASVGTVSVQSSIKRTGDYALRVNPTTTAIGYARFSGINPDGDHGLGQLSDSYARFYFYVATLPASASEEIWSARTVSALKMAVRITSAGKLQAYNNTGTAQMGSDGATTLSTGVWYRIEVYCGSGAAASWEIRINGTTELSGTGDLNAAVHFYSVYGKFDDRNSQSVDFYYDDVYVEIATWPGPGQIERMDPDGDGNYTAWTIGAGAGADWTNVDDIPHDSATTYLTSSVDTNAETVTLESAASAGISGTIKAIRGMILVDDNASGSKVAVRLRANATDSDATGRTPATGYEAFHKILQTDPSDAGAWTTADLDTLEIGGLLTATGEMRMTMACVMVDFQPADVNRIHSDASFGRLDVGLPGVVAY